jgi:hypothetical protein
VTCPASFWSTLETPTHFKDYEAHLSCPWNFLLYLLILVPHIRSADQRFAAKVVLWLDV